MKILLIILLFSLSSIYSENLTKNNANHNDIVVSNAFVRMMPKKVKNSAAFMDIINNSTNDDILLSANANISEKVELHTHKKVKNNMKKMMRVKDIKLKAKEVTSLKIGGLHIMFINLKKPLEENQLVEITLNFKKNISKIINVPVLYK